MSRTGFAVIMLAGALLASCATLPGETAASREFIAAQKELAATLENNGRLAQALAAWRSILPLGSDAETRAAIRSLEQRIANAVDKHIANAKRSYAAGNSRQGDHTMLRVLALQPGNETALRWLGKSAAAHAHAQQLKNSTAKYPVTPTPAQEKTVAIERQLQSLFNRGDYAAVVAQGTGRNDVASPRTNSATANLLRQAHIKLADAAQDDSNSEQALAHLQAAMLADPVADDPLVERSLALRAELSKRWYKEGSRLLQSDLDSAIEALRQALHYNPYNKNARRKLDQAETMKRNLEKITAHK